MVELKFGFVVEINASACTARVQFDDNDGIVSPPLLVPVKQGNMNKDYWMPEIGDYVSCLLDENGERGLIQSSHYTDERKPSVTDPDVRQIAFSDGMSVTFNRKTHTIVVDCPSDVTVKSATKLIFDAPETEVTGNLTVLERTVMEGGFESNSDSNTNGRMLAERLVTETGIDMEYHVHPIDDGDVTGQAQM